MAGPSHLPPDIDRKLALSCFKTHREDLLIIEYCLPTLTNSLYAKNLITRDVYKKACNEYQGMTERVMAVLDCLESTFEAESSNFTKVIDIFKSDRFLEQVACKLIQTYISSASSVQNVPPSASSPLDKPLGAADHSAIFRYLEDLTKQNIIDVGVQLGLKYTKLTDLSGGSEIKNELIRMWLNGHDYVLDKSGIPTWRSLTKALEDNGFRGIADKIRNDIGSSVHEQ